MAHPPLSTDPHRRAPTGHGDVVYPAFWVAATALVMLALFGVPLGHSAAVTMAAVVFIGGGLPHGAYDIALLRRAVTLDRLRLALAVGSYALVALSMAGLWFTVPLVALIVFLGVAAVHFGEDWQMLDEPLLRVAAGAAVIAAPTIGHPAAVAALFAAMSDGRSVIIEQLIMAAAPVTLLVTAVGISMAWRGGSRRWAAAMALCLVLLIVLPPVAGFTLFFVFLHSPRHLAQVREVLPDLSGRRWLATGGTFSAIAIAGWFGVRQLAGTSADQPIAATGFQLLAAVAVPHLLLSRWLARLPDMAVDPRSA